jgi:hypothetical protein
MVSIWTDGQTGESIVDAKGNDVSVQGLDALKTSWYEWTYHSHHFCTIQIDKENE